jgi:hypothetical protein
MHNSLTVALHLLTHQAAGYPCTLIGKLPSGVCVVLLYCVGCLGCIDALF